MIKKLRFSDREILFLFLLFSKFSHNTRASFSFEAIEPDTTFVESVEGYNASLPCAIPNPPKDSPVLTLWYIGTEETPVYSYDQRSFASPSSWADNSVMGSRAIFLPGEHPPVLLLVNVSRSDAKTYRCRVDYNYSNSRVSWVRLSVVVPARNLVIETHLSPVEIGQINDVVCKVLEGFPPAKVVWMQKGEIVDDSFINDGNISVNTLDVSTSREDLTEPFTCSANNNDVTPALTENYLRNVTCGPLSVRIVSDEASLTENRLTRFECIVIGSNPPPKVSWFIENNQILRYIKTISGRNKTVSKLDLLLKKDHHKDQLVCRAENHLLPQETVEDILVLNVAYKPIVSLSLGRSLNPFDLKESNDVFFECHISANPPPYKVRWFHEGKSLEHNITAGVLVSANSLALQRVTRARSGRYQCSASNVEGDTLSNHIEINIKYAPRCAVAPSLRGVALGELTNVTCLVDADPSNVTFQWEFNNSIRKDTSEFVSQRKYTQEKLKSVLSYTPLSERDYGTLFCSATNRVGKQKEPCSFTVISAGPPESVTNCTAGNMTSHSVGIQCQQGFDGGLPQMFLLQIFEARSGVLVKNMTSNSPSFVVKPLESGMTFHASITAFNSRGKSTPNSLRFRTLREATMHKILPSKVEPSPLIWLGGVIFGIIFVVSTLLVVIWIIKRRPSYQGTQPQISTVVLKENNPDLINMEGSEERLTELEGRKSSSSESLVVAEEQNTLFDNQENLTTSNNPHRETGGFSIFDDGESSLFLTASPDVNEKTRLTSPRNFRRERLGVRENFQPRKQTIVRLQKDTGPESTF